MKHQAVKVNIDEIGENEALSIGVPFEVDTRQSMKNPTSLVIKMSHIQRTIERSGSRVDFTVNEAMMGFIDLSGGNRLIHHTKMY